MRANREPVSRAVPSCSGIVCELFKDRCDWTRSLHLYLQGTALLAGPECRCEMLILTNTIYCVLCSYLLFWLKPEGIWLFCSCSVPCLVLSLDGADPQLWCLDQGVFSWVLCLFPLPRKVTGGSPCMRRALTQDGIHRDGPTHVLPAVLQLMAAFKPFKPSLLCPLCLRCSTRQVPSLWLFFQAWLHIATHLHIRSTLWMIFAPVQAEKWHLSRDLVSQEWGTACLCPHCRWNYMISNCRKSPSRLGWAEDLIGYVFFFSSFAVKAWLLEQLCNHKGKAFSCWLGGVLAWLHRRSWFLCEHPSQLFRAWHTPCPYSQLQSQRVQKLASVFMKQPMAGMK